MAYKLDNVKVLLVDDMPPMVELTKTILQTFGFTDIHTAANGQDGFKKYCEVKPDFIITDWQMAPMDGLEMIDKIRKDPKSPNPFIPVIMMTGFSSRERVMNARDRGITEFMVKPFTARDLYARVFQIIEKPRQFVSTEEFFGPDRRRKRIKDYTGAQRRGNDRDKNAPGTDDILKKLRDEVKQL